GTAVTVTGSGFTGATAVDFGNIPATNVAVVSGTQITATTPAQGTGTVAVTAPGGTSPAVPADQFTYALGPIVSKITPRAGPVAGGTVVTITGTGFSGVTAVKFGSLAATSFTPVSSTQITATAPAHAPGAVDITVTTPGGASPAAASDIFTYVPAPAVTKVTPAAGPVTGGTAVTIFCFGVTGATAVRFGGIAATFTIVSGTQITATAPAHAAGAVDVTVTTAGGASPAGTADRFTYAPAPAITGIIPAAGPLGG